eukprot:s929_g15.t2
MRRTEGTDAAKAWRRWLLFCSIGYAPKQRSEAACRLPSQSAPYSRFHVGVLASELRKVTDTRGPLQSSKFSRSGFAICLFVSPFSGGLLPLALRMQAYDKSSNKGYINFGGARDHLHLVKCPPAPPLKSSQANTAVPSWTATPLRAQLSISNFEELRKHPTCSHADHGFLG